jgi:hypothetical protein
MDAAQLSTLRFCDADVHSTSSEKWEGDSQWHCVSHMLGAELEEPTSPEKRCATSFLSLTMVRISTPVDDATSKISNRGNSFPKEINSMAA